MPKDLKARRIFLLRKAKQKYKHALRITERHSPDPFNQAREHLVYTMIELGEFGEAERLGRDFVEQKVSYLDVARTRLADVELDWKKALLADPKMKGTKKELPHIEKRDESKKRVRAAESQIVDFSLLLGEVLLRMRRFKESICVVKEILSVVPDHNAAFRRIGQAYAHLEEHGLAASYMDKAFQGIERRIREIRDRFLSGDSAPGETEELTKSVDRRDRKEQVKALEAALMEVAAVTATLYFLTRETARSSHWFSRVDEVDPTSKYLELKMGLALRKQGRAKAAKEHLDAFRKSLPRDGGGLFRTLLERIEAKPIHGRGR